MFKKTALYVIIISSTIFHTLTMSSSNNSNTFSSMACHNFTNPLYMNFSAYCIAQNVIVSPSSLYMILSLLSNGAEGSTLNELRSVLGCNTESLNDDFETLITWLNDMKNVTLYLGNAVYVQKKVDLEGDFLSICMNTFKSSISKIDFKNKHAAEIIDLFVRTTLKMEEAYINFSYNLPRYTDTEILLVSPIYFKCRWLKMFKEENTKPRIFHVSETISYNVATMSINATYFYGEIPALHTQFIEIPYLNEDIVMIILLPYEDVKLQDVINKFTWETLINEHRFSDDFELYLPKFRFRSIFDLKYYLQMKLKFLLVARTLNLETMMLENINFPRISKLPLTVGAVLQHIYIDVQEQGSLENNANVTVAETKLKRRYISPVKFVVDRPFIFVIEHKPTKLPLFFGTVYDPQKTFNDEG